MIPPSHQRRKGRLGPYKLLAGLFVFTIGLVQAQSEALAGVRFAHLSPDTPLVDLIVNETPADKDLEFTNVTGYVWLPPGRHELTVYPHRAPEQSAGVDLLDLQNVLNNNEERAEQRAKVAKLEPFRIAIDVAAGRYYTVALTGFYTPPSTVPDLGSLSLEVEAGTRVRVMGPRAYLTHLAESHVLTGLEPGQYTIDAKREGFEDVQYTVTVNAGQGATLGITLEEGSSVQAPGEAAAPPELAPTQSWRRAQLYLYEDSYETFPAPGQALIRVVHAAPRVDALELHIAAHVAPEPRLTQANAENEEETEQASLLISRVSFADASPYVSVPAGEQRLEVSLADSDFGLISLPATLSPGVIYSLYVSAGLSEQVLTPVPSVDAVLRAPLDD